RKVFAVRSPCARRALAVRSPCARYSFAMRSLCVSHAFAKGKDEWVSMSMDDVLTQPLTQLVSEVGSGRLKATTLVEEYLKRIDALDPRLHAMITVAAESALHEAALCDQEAGAGRLRGPLHGMPIAVKDSIDTAGIRTTGNSRLFEHVVPAEDATAVARLKAAGAIIIGKTNLNEL